MLVNTPPRHPRMFIHAPAVVLSGRVNLIDPPEYPIFAFAYTTPEGDFEDVEAGMTVIMGTTPGGRDLGMQRVMGADAIGVDVGHSSRGRRIGELMLVHNAYFTILDERRLWSKLPFIDLAGEVFKDGHIELVDQTEFPPPIAVLGKPAVGTGTGEDLLLRVELNGSGSYAVADGATITDFEWQIRDGTLISGALDEAVCVVDFPPGARYPSLKVTDSNGNSHTGTRPVFVDDDEHTLSTDQFLIEGHSASDQGHDLTVRLLSDLPRGTYPDGMQVMIWDREPSSPTDWEGIQFVGFHHSDNVSLQAQETAFLRNTSLALLGLGGKADKLAGFAQTLTDELLRDEEIEPEMTWQYMPEPNLDKFTLFLVHWHTTLAAITDILPSGTWGFYPFVELQASGDSIWGQISNLAQMIVPDYHLTCNRIGQIRMIRDINLLDAEDRPETIILELQEDEWSEVSWPYNYFPSAHVLWGRAKLTATEYVEVDDDTIISTVMSVSPGSIFGQGLSESTWREQLTQSQADLNKVTGHRWERINAPFGNLTIRVPGTLIRDIDFGLEAWVLLHISAEKAAQRGLDSTLLRGRLRSFTLSYNEQETGQTVDGTVTLELETVGLPAFSWEPGVGASPDDGDWEPPTLTPPTIPPSEGLEEGTGTLAGIGYDGHLYRTTNLSAGTPTYDEVDLATGALYSYINDPFSPGHTEGAGLVNGWVVGDTDIYRVTDIHGTPVATSVFTFPVATSMASFHWRTIQASFGGFFSTGNPWLVCVSYYGNTPGHEGTWATYSMEDAGATWSAEIQISAEYDSVPFERFRPIGVFTSPRTPGYALTAAHTAVEEDPLEPLPHWGLWDEDLGVLISTSVGSSFDYSIVAESIAGEGLVETPEWRILLAPPANAVRVLIECSYYHDRTQSGASGGFSHGVGYTVGRTPIANLSETETLTFNAGVTNGTPAEQDYTVEWTRTSGADWPGNRDELPAVTGFASFARWRMYVSAATSGDKTARAELRHTASIVEIELENGHIYTPAPSLIGGSAFAATDWGESWTPTPLLDPGAAFAGTIHVPWTDNLAEPLAYYGFFQNAVIAEVGPLPDWEEEDDAGARTPGAAGPSASYFRELIATGSGSAITETEHLHLIPPTDAKKVYVHVDWMAHRGRDDPSCSASVTISAHGAVGRTGSINFVTLSGYPDTNTGSGDLVYTWTGGAWPADGIYFSFILGAQGDNPDESATAVAQLTATVTQIELDNGTIYTPVEASSGRNFRLKQSNGGVISDISPTDGTRFYGVNRGPFGVRSHDSNRQYMLAAVIGNDVTGDPDDDMHALYISSTGGVTWDEVIAPFADSGAPTNRPALEAAFAGETEQAIYIWGPPAYMKYSDDFGVTVQDKSGNLAALGCPGFLGITGGPTG